MLTEGYLSGWLTFDEKTPTSKFRENYILSAIERKQAVEALRLRTNIEASLISGAMTQETVKRVYDNYDSYLSLALPYISKPDSIKSEGKPINKAEIGHWKQFLKNRKQQLNHLKS